MLFRPIVVPSLMIVLRSVSLGLPLLLLPSGTHFNACSVNLLLFILSTCPIYVHLFFLIVVATYCCFTSSLICLFVLNSSHLMFKNFLRHLFSNAFSFFSSVFVIFQLSQPYVSTDNTLELNRRSLVYLLNVFDFQMLVRLLNTFAAKAIRVEISFFVSPSCVILLPK